MKVKPTKVTMLVAIAGGPDSRYGLSEFSFRPGDEVDLHPELAAAWMAAGHAGAPGMKVAKPSFVALSPMQSRQALINRLFRSGASGR